MRSAAHIPHENIAKARLAAFILEKNLLTAETAFISELALESFSRRADFVTVDQTIQIFEIKTAADNLRRLPGQLATFAKYCDKLHVLCAPCHTEQAISIAPTNVAIWELNDNGKIKIVRRGQTTLLLEKLNLLKLVNAQELRQILSAKKIRLDSYRRKNMQLAINSSFTALEVRELVLTALKQRYEQTTKLFLDAIAVSGAHPEHLDFLKRQRTPSRDGLQIFGGGHIAENQESEDFHLKRLISTNQSKYLFGELPDDIRQILKYA